MRISFRRAALVLALAGAGSLYGNTLQLEPAQDNTLFQNASGLVSNGAGPHAFVGVNNGGVIRRALLQFDLGVLPAGSIIDAASLTLNASQTQGTTPQVTLQAVTQAWGEGGSDAGSPGGSGAPSQPGDATWVHTFYNTGSWTSAGGDFAATISGSGTPAGVGSFTIPSSPQMVADVQSWFATPAANFGWIVRGVESPVGNVLRIDSRENSVPENRPHLSIDFTPPTHSWNQDQDGNWDDLGNWAGGVVPGALARR